MPRKASKSVERPIISLFWPAQKLNREQSSYSGRSYIYDDGPVEILELAEPFAVEIAIPNKKQMDLLVDTNRRLGVKPVGPHFWFPKGASFWVPWGKNHNWLPQNRIQVCFAPGTLVHYQEWYQGGGKRHLRSFNCSIFWQYGLYFDSSLFKGSGEQQHPGDNFHTYVSLPRKLIDTGRLLVYAPKHLMKSIQEVQGPHILGLEK